MKRHCPHFKQCEKLSGCDGLCHDEITEFSRMIDRQHALDQDLDPQDFLDME